MTNGLGGMVIVPAMCCAVMVGAGAGVGGQIGMAAANGSDSWTLVVLPAAAAVIAALAAWHHKSSKTNLADADVDDEGRRVQPLAEVATTWSLSSFASMFLASSVVSGIVLAAID